MGRWADEKLRDYGDGCGWGDGWNYVVWIGRIMDIDMDKEKFDRKTDGWALGFVYLIRHLYL